MADTLRQSWTGLGTADHGRSDAAQERFCLYLPCGSIRRCLKLHTGDDTLSQRIDHPYGIKFGSSA